MAATCDVPCSHHIVLLGDSVLDNKAYTGSGPCVLEHLEAKISSRNWVATNCAVDGDVTKDVLDEQIKHIPAAATVIVVSAGGNDGLQLLSSLEAEGVTVCSFTRKIWQIRHAFRARYAAMLTELQKLGLPIIVCTIYYPRFDDEAGAWCTSLTQRVSCAGVFFLNSVIRAEARARGLAIIELAWAFNNVKDYANAIEPSAFGGDKISSNIIRAVEEHSSVAGRSISYWSREYTDTNASYGSRHFDRTGITSRTGGDPHRLARAARNESFRKRVEIANTDTARPR